MKLNFNQYLKANNIRIQLKKLNIFITDFGFITLTDNQTENYYYKSLIEDLNKKHGVFFIGPTPEEIVTLALAVTQEEQNNYIQQDDINFVNDFFGFTITFDDVQKFNSKYI